MASPPVAPAKVHYPSSDGRPMAESDFQRTPLTYAVDRLRRHFRGRRDVYVSGNLLLYYREGNPRASVAPDVFVVLGVSNADRSSYRLCEEPKDPDFASASCTVRWACGSTGNITVTPQRPFFSSP